MRPDFVCTSAQTQSLLRWFHCGNLPMWSEKTAIARSGSRIETLELQLANMNRASANGVPALPGDVLIVEDDPIIALDFEYTIAGFGVKSVRTAPNVAKALETIAERAPDFALLDVGLLREKSFAVAER